MADPKTLYGVFFLLGGLAGAGVTLLALMGWVRSLRKRSAALQKRELELYEAEDHLIQVRKKLKPFSSNN